MGVSLAHLTAIIVPIIGAALWQRLGYQFPFPRVPLHFISLWLTQKIDVEKQRIPGAPLPSLLRAEAERKIEADAPPFPEDSGPVVSPLATIGLAREERGD